MYRNFFEKVNRKQDAVLKSEMSNGSAGRRVSKVVLAVMLALFFFPKFASAQLELEIGYVNSMKSMKDYGKENTVGVKKSNLGGFTIGLATDFEIAKGFSIRPALKYSYATATSRMDFKDYIITDNISEHYLDIPLMVNYTFKAHKKVDISFFTGPVVSVGLSFNERYDYIFYKDEVKSTVKINHFKGSVLKDNVLDDRVVVPESVDKYKRFDVRYGVGAAVTLFDMVSVRGGYDWGLLQRYDNRMVDGTKYSFRRDMFYITVAVLF